MDAEVNALNLIQFHTTRWPQPGFPGFRLFRNIENNTVSYLEERNEIWNPRSDGAPTTRQAVFFRANLKMTYVFEKTSENMAEWPDPGAIVVDDFQMDFLSGPGVPKKDGSPEKNMACF